jgi:TonB family protein
MHEVIKRALLVSWIAVVPALAGEVIEPSLRPEGRVAPEYPPAALSVQIEGAVTVAAHVGADGVVQGVDVLECTHPSVGFEEAVLAAVEQWEFDPARLDGDPVDSVVVYRVGFNVPRLSPGLDRPVAWGERLSTGLNMLGLSPRDAARTVGETRGNTPASDRSRRLELLKPKMPPNCLGCMYDRRHILPQQVRGGGGQATPK